jgi:hypothetical protein
MTEQVKVTEADFRAVAGRLEDLGQQLPANQKIVLHWLLERAQSAGPEGPIEDVAGYALPGGPTAGAAGVHTGSQVWGLSGLSPASNLKIEISGGPIIVDVQ